MPAGPAAPPRRTRSPLSGSAGCSSACRPPEICSGTALISRSILPATAKRFDEMNACTHLKVGRLGQRQLIGQQGPLGIDDGEIVHEAVCVLDLRKAPVVFRR